MAMRNFIDLTGQKIDSLTVIKRVEDYIEPSGKSVIQWLCKCDCGNEYFATSKYLNGKQKGEKSCGCKNSRKLKDLTGQRFGKLVVIKRVEDYIHGKNKKITPKWLCKCDCGNELTVIGDRLKRGETKSCGCYKTEFAKKYNIYDLSGEYGIGYTLKNEPFYFDLEDYDLIKKYYWKTKYGYIQAWDSNTRKYIFLHRLIMNPSPNFFIDHINHKKNDNRKDNLRIVTLAQNSMNKAKSRNNTSGVTGVSYFTNAKKWVATIKKDYKKIHLGYFEQKEDAIKARKEAEEKYFGKYSYDNSMKKDEDTYGKNNNI